jgi:hypothetical protein
MGISRPLSKGRRSPRFDAESDSALRQVSLGPGRVRLEPSPVGARVRDCSAPRGNIPFGWIPGPEAAGPGVVRDLPPVSWIGTWEKSMQFRSAVEVFYPFDFELFAFLLFP